MAADKPSSDAVHLEAGHEVSKTNVKPMVVDTSFVLNDHAVTLDSEELREQMTAQVKATKLKFTSTTTLRLCFFLFVAYCSESSVTKRLPSGLFEYEY